MLITTEPRFAEELVPSSQHVVGTEQIDLHHRTKGVGRHTQRRCREVPGGAGDEHVDVAERLVRGIERRTRRPDVPHVGSRTHGLVAELPQPTNGRFHLVLRPTHHRYARTGRGETLCYAQVDPAGATCHEHGYPGAIHCDSTHCPILSVINDSPRPHRGAQSWNIRRRWPIVVMNQNPTARRHRLLNDAANVARRYPENLDDHRIGDRPLPAVESSTRAGRDASNTRRSVRLSDGTNTATRIHSTGQ